MLELISVILVALWFLGLATGLPAGMIQLLIGLAFVAVLLRVLGGLRPVV